MEKAPQIDWSGRAMRAWSLLKDTEFLKHVPPDIDPLMTRDTAVGFEDGVSSALLSAQSLGMVPEVVIEARVRRYQGAHVSRQGVPGHGPCQAPRVQSCKRGPVVWLRTEPGQEYRPGGVHQGLR